MANKDPKRQIVVIGLLVAVAGFVAWQVMGMFSSHAPEPVKTAANQPPPPPMPKPKQAEVPQAPAPLTEREVQLMQLQQETEAKYIAAVNELQMLKLQRDIAETNRAIAAAKLDTVNSQKGIVSLLAPEQTPNYGQQLTNPAQGAPTGQGPATLNVNYTVISVSEIQGRWSAVVGASGKLYNVHVGDVLPDDNSKVTSIDRSGVILDRNGMTRTVSLVPII